MRTSLILCAVLCPVSMAETPAERLDKLLTELPRQSLHRSALGVTRKQTPIPYFAGVDDVDPLTPKLRLLLLADPAERHSTQATVACLKWWYTNDEAKPLREKYSLSAVPCLDIDGRGLTFNRGYPPKGEAYSDTSNPETLYLWRWLGIFAPDLVIVVRTAMTITEIDGLIPTLKKTAPSGVGTIPAREIVFSSRTPEKEFAEFLSKLPQRGHSLARQEIRRRLDRTPEQVAMQLARRYGQELSSVEYIAGMALVGRLRLGELTKNPRQRADVEKIVAPYLDGAKSTGTDKANAAQLAGHLVFGELANLKKDERTLELLRRAADRCLGERGVPGHSDMSDAVFMGCPLLARAGLLTGEKKYLEACERNLSLMQKLCLRKDGLYRHSPLDETAWGRGNGFPALGLALSLSDLPRDFAGRESILKAFRAHMTALLAHQDIDGTWHQVIDFPGSYRELSCTCMITLAMARGVREGWLDRKTYEPAIKKGWQAIKARVAADGSLIDVCTGTGKQKSLRDYLDRKAILGVDPRGGAMVLLVAVEMMTQPK